MKAKKEKKVTKVAKVKRAKQPYSARRLLFPLIPLYRLALICGDLLSLLEPVQRLRFPVISVGNLSTGGAGKTPLTIALAKALAARGLRVDVLSRGYGRQSLLPARVKPDGAAEEFGDEPLLIARETGLPVYVAPLRYQAGLLAEAEHVSTNAEVKPAKSTTPLETAGKHLPVPGIDFSRADTAARTAAALASEKSAAALVPAKSADTLAPDKYVHLLDDGFQHRQLSRDVNILLLDQRDWRDWLLPAGNLREPREAIRRASVLAIPADEPELEAELRIWGWLGPLWRLNRIMKAPFVRGPVVAFCGIARPEQFFAGLEDGGLELAARFAFSDHFTYTRDVLELLLASGRKTTAVAFVTTEKDLARLGKLASVFPKSMPLLTAKLHTKIEDEGAAIDWLMDRVAPATSISAS